MQTIGAVALNNVLDARGKTEPVSMLTVTEPNMRSGRAKNGVYPNPFVEPVEKTHPKAKNWQSRVLKVGWRSVFIGADYGNCVNHQRKRETPDGGSFEFFQPEELWNGAGERVTKYIVTNVNADSQSFGRLYLAVKTPNQRKSPLEASMLGVRYVWRDTETPLTEDEVAELKTWLNERDVESTCDHQGVDRPVFWNTIELCNIKQIKVGGKEYNLNMKRSQYPAVLAKQNELEQAA